MIVYRIRHKVIDDWMRKWYPVEDGHIYFRKDKMSNGQGVIYLTNESAQRALSQIYGGADKYEIVPFEITEVVQ